MSDINLNELADLLEGMTRDEKLELLADIEDQVGIDPPYRATPPQSERGDEWPTEGDTND